MTTRGFSFDFSTSTLTISKAFQKAAESLNSEEYNIIKQYKADFPELSIVLRTVKKHRKSTCRPTYDKMVKYLSCQENAPMLLQSFSDIRERAKSQENPYLYVKKWFDMNFPNYAEIPMVNSNGKLVTPTPHINIDAA